MASTNHDDNQAYVDSSRYTVPPTMLHRLYKTVIHWTYTFKKGTDVEKYK